MSRGLKQVQLIALAQFRASPGKSVLLLIGTAALIFLVVRQVSGGAKPADAETTPDWVVPQDATGANAATAALTVPRPTPPNIATTLWRNPFDLEWLGGAGPADLSTGTGEGEGGTEAALQLQSTLTVEGVSSTAVINGVIVHEGSVVAGYTVQRIADRTVVLQRGDRLWTLTMP